MSRDEPPRIGAYRILEVLGKGGMGAVYRGRHVETGEACAVKVLLESGRGPRDPEMVRRFEREGEALERVDHPAVVRIHDRGVDERVGPWYAMELLGGETVSDAIEDGPLEPGTAARVALDLAGALAVVHEEGVVHRDLKPENLVFRTDGRPVIADFGLARLSDASRLTATGDALGTPGYMSPEQAAGEPHRFGPATDVYGLGACLYAMLDGRPPFRGGSVLNLLHDVLMKPPPALPEEVPADLRAIVRRCLAKEPDERYPSAWALADDLEAHVEGRPVEAAGGRRRTVPRWRVAGVVALVLLVAGGAWWALGRRTDPVVAERSAEPGAGAIAEPVEEPATRAEPEDPARRLREDLRSLEGRIFGAGDEDLPARGELREVRRRASGWPGLEAEVDRLEGMLEAVQAATLRDMDRARTLALDGLRAAYTRRGIPADLRARLGGELGGTLVLALDLILDPEQLGSFADMTMFEEVMALEDPEPTPVVRRMRGRSPGEVLGLLDRLASDHPDRVMPLAARLFHELDDREELEAVEVEPPPELLGRVRRYRDDLAFVEARGASLPTAGHRLWHFLERLSNWDDLDTDLAAEAIRRQRIPALAPSGLLGELVREARRENLRVLGAGAAPRRLHRLLVRASVLDPWNGTPMALRVPHLPRGIDPVTGYVGRRAYELRRTGIDIVRLLRLPAADVEDESFTLVRHLETLHMLPTDLLLARVRWLLEGGEEDDEARPGADRSRARELLRRLVRADPYHGEGLELLAEHVSPDEARDVRARRDAAGRELSNHLEVVRDPARAQDASARDRLASFSAVLHARPVEELPSRVPGDLVRVAVEVAGSRVDRTEGPSSGEAIGQGLRGLGICLVAGRPGSPSGDESLLSSLDLLLPPGEGDDGVRPAFLDGARQVLDRLGGGAWGPEIAMARSLLALQEGRHARAATRGQRLEAARIHAIRAVETAPAAPGPMVVLGLVRFLEAHGAEDEAARRSLEAAEADLAAALDVLGDRAGGDDEAPGLRALARLARAAARRGLGDEEGADADGEAWLGLVGEEAAEGWGGVLPVLGEERRRALEAGE